MPYCIPLDAQRVPSRSWPKQECWAKQIQTIIYLVFLASPSCTQLVLKGLPSRLGSQPLKGGRPQGKLQSEDDEAEVKVSIQVWNFTLDDWRGSPEARGSKGRGGMNRYCQLPARNPYSASQISRGNSFSQLLPSSGSTSPPHLPGKQERLTRGQMWHLRVARGWRSGKRQEIFAHHNNKTLKKKKATKFQ